MLNTYKWNEKHGVDRGGSEREREREREAERFVDVRQGSCHSAVLRTHLFRENSSERKSLFPSLRDSQRFIQMKQDTGSLLAVLSASSFASTTSICVHCRSYVTVLSVKGELKRTLSVPFEFDSVKTRRSDEFSSRKESRVEARGDREGAKERTSEIASGICPRVAASRFPHGLTVLSGVDSCKLGVSRCFS